MSEQIDLSRNLAEVAVETHYGKNVLSLVIVVLFAALGGFLT